MKQKILSIPNISCDHCAHTIQNELMELDGVTVVTADSRTRRVSVSWERPASLDRILATLREIDYPAEEDG